MKIERIRQDDTRTVRTLTLVGAFPGHIVCDPESKSEIVVPVLRGGDVLGVLDLDSPLLSYFDAVDKNYLERIVKLVLPKF